MTYVCSSYFVRYTSMLPFKNMTDDIQEFDENRALRRHTLVIACFITAYGLLGVYAVYQDWVEEVSLAHLIVEGTMNLLAIIVGAYLFIRLTNSKQKSLRDLRAEYNSVRLSADVFRAKADKFKEGITGAINQQLKQWKFTPAEEDICYMLLKGFSLQEIADLRETSERTIRQQASMLYKKSGLSGRAQLSAFFLEDLLVVNKPVQAKAVLSDVSEKCLAVN